ncbi:MAG: LPS export ABC transporter periplasmic protein LptC [Gammaproteobacteria bacterium]|nr:LPS export ABC transporter periplasmic protein LptC [Gammaproteobacteria bacterium]
MKRLVSLSIIAIAALIFWGSKIWENKQVINTLESSDPHYINVFIRDFTITAMDENGQPAYILKANKLEHYNDNEYAVIEAPVIELTQGEHHWMISARSGEIDDTNQRITLLGEVILQQQNKPQPIRLETEQLEIDTRQQTAKSTQTVNITQQKFNLQSTGMILNNASGKLELLNSVKGNYVQIR